jgi:tRNA nucleotidyltransferase (CCA-adding enzyme)
MQIFRVGGAVRDRLLNYPSQENDWVVVGSSPEEMVDKGFIPIGNDFPVFIKPETGEEYALARTERSSAKGYAGFTFFTDPKIGLEEDLKRRDLTINAMAEDNDGTIIDPFNGQRDVESKTLRHVSDAFNEDPVRVLRIARFAARYAHMGFTIAPETSSLIIEMVRNGDLQYLVAERIWKEMSRALSEKSPHVFIQTLHTLGALEDTLPELYRLFNGTKASTHPLKKTRCEDSLKLLKATSRLTEKISVRFSALVYNLDKGPFKDNRLESDALRTDQCSSIETLCNRLKVPRDFKNLAMTVSEFCLQSHNCLELKPITLLQLLKSIGAFKSSEKFSDFLTVCSADFSCNHSRIDRSYSSSTYLRGALESVLKVSVKDLVASGQAGAAIGLSLEKRQVDALNHFKHNFTS